MPSEERTLTGGELNAAITSAVVGIHTAHLGRGPSSASTFHKVIAFISGNNTDPDIASELFILDIL
jgi:hypothetical protein